MPFPFTSRFQKGTRSTFGKKKYDEAPPMPEPAPPVIQTRPVPNKAKEADQQEEESSELDRSLVPPEKPVRDELKPADRVAKEGQSSTEPHTTSDNMEDNIFHIIWRSENSYRMIPEQENELNEYVPNSMAMFSLLEAAEARINTTKHIQEHEMNYCPYAVKVYYAYMYYIQILRARKAAGSITGFENSLLKRFEVKYAMTSLPCAEIVYPYFRTIISTELAEAKYDWICPKIAIDYPPVSTATATRGSNMHAFTTTNGAAFVQPMVPHMVAVLNSFIQAPAGTNPTLNDEDQFIPADMNVAAHGDIHVFGATIKDNDDDHADLKPLFSSAGLSSPCEFGNANYPQASKAGKKTDFGRDIKLVVNTQNVRQGQGLSTVHNAKDLDSFLLMDKTSNLKFFGYLLTNAIIHARFFDKVYFFSDVQTTGGLETAILCQLKRTGATRTFPDTSVEVGQAAQWYPRTFANMQAGFATNRAGVRRNEELQALSFGTNATLPITGLADLKTGAFWANTEWIQSMFYDQQHALTNTGKPMFFDHNNAVLKCFREKPHGTGIVDNNY